MDMSGRNGRVAGCDRDLIQVRDDVSYRIKTRHRGLPMLVDDEASPFGVARTEVDCKVRAHLAAKDWIT